MHNVVENIAAAFKFSFCQNKTSLLPTFIPYNFLKIKKRPDGGEPH